MKYIFCIIALLIQPFFSWIVYRKQDKRQAALKMPMIYISGIYCVIQFFVFMKYCLKFPEDYQIYAYLIQGGILACFLLVEIAMIFSNHYIRDIEKKEQNSIADFKQIQQALEVKKVLIKDVYKLNQLEKIYEKMRYADSVSSQNVAAENMALQELVQNLDDETDNQEFEKQCNKIIELLEIRKIKNVKERG